MPDLCEDVHVFPGEVGNTIGHIEKGSWVYHTGFRVLFLLWQRIRKINDARRKDQGQREEEEEGNEKALLAGGSRS